VPQRWRDDFWHRIEQSPHLDWLLLTKRPQNIAKMLPDPRSGITPWGEGWPNVWLGTTAENQEEADRRIPALLGTPAAKRFISAEPLLGSMRIDYIDRGPRGRVYPLAGMEAMRTRYPDGGTGDFSAPTRIDGKIDWVIVGGESGHGARPMHPTWARSLRDQCHAAKVPFFFKQWGAWYPDALLYTDLEGRCPPPKMLIGKKAAGRLLDGREWSEHPA
jgi:protein gp37